MIARESFALRNILNDISDITTSNVDYKNIQSLSYELVNLLICKLSICKIDM